MKLMHRRAVSVLLLSAFFGAGLLVFLARYAMNSSTWAQYPVNKHIYSNGELIGAGTVYDRNGEILVQTSEGERQYHSHQITRIATMHAVGDLRGNVSTGVQRVFSRRLSGWDPLNGVYRYEDGGAAGMDITLTLDAELCARAYQALGNRKGAVGVFNYKTGDILCMVSSPSFDPQSPPDLEADPEKYEGVYLNRFLSVCYTPGSVFKLVTAAVAIENISDIEERIFHCDGEVLIDGVRVTCPMAHGDVTFEQSLAHSCNVSFAEITGELGARTLQKYVDDLGLNSAFKVSGIPTAAGKVDVSEAVGADLAWAGIGQYTDTVNPLNFMAFIGAIANGGKRVSPRLIAENRPFSEMFTSIHQIMPEATALRLKDMMRNNVISNYGEYNFSGLELCAKSGTGEVGGGKAPNAWFVGFLDRPDCPLAFAVIIENGGSGLGAAGPVAGEIMQEAVRIMG
ncbi:MAG: penicillin-binding protein [Clostridiales bacterium]|mgnify:FL=1|nr:penicillin-binding protein [Clostridiales bacterium]